MSDEEYGEHLNQLFERVRRGEIHEPEPHQILARTAEDIEKILNTRAPAFGYQGKETGIHKRTGKDAESQGIKCAQ